MSPMKTPHDNHVEFIFGEYCQYEVTYHVIHMQSKLVGVFVIKLTTLYLSVTIYSSQLGRKVLTTSDMSYLPLNTRGKSYNDVRCSTVTPQGSRYCLKILG